MKIVKTVKIAGNVYTLDEILHSKHCIIKVKLAIAVSQKCLLTLFKFLAKKEMEREWVIKRQVSLEEKTESLNRVFFDFLPIYGEWIKSFISIDRLIEAANVVNYMDFFSYLICNLSDYVEKEKEDEYRKKILQIMRKTFDFDKIEKFIYDAKDNLSQEEKEFLLDMFIKHDDFYCCKIVAGKLSDCFDMKKIVQKFEEEIDKLIAEEDIEGMLLFIEFNLKEIFNYKNVDFTNCINKIISFILLKGTVEEIYRLALKLRKTPYFRKIVNILIKTNHWKYWSSIVSVFVNCSEISEEDKAIISDLVSVTLNTQVPAYIYYFVTRSKKVLSETDIRRILVTMIELEDEMNDRTYTEYLITELKSIHLSQDIKELIERIYPNLSTRTFLNHGEKVTCELYEVFYNPTELKCAKDCGRVSEDLSLDKIGVAIHEDGSFDNAKQLVLSNIAAGL